MALITPHKPYIVHTRSLDRHNGSISDYVISMKQALTCRASEWMRCTLLSAHIPNTFYQIDNQNNSLVLTFNKMLLPDGFQIFQSYIDIPLAAALATATKTKRSDFERKVTVTLTNGNYGIEALLSEVVTKMNTACAAAHASENFVTFLRTNNKYSTEFGEELVDGPLVGNDYLIPVGVDDPEAPVGPGAVPPKLVPAPVTGASEAVSVQPIVTNQSGQLVANPRLQTKDYVVSQPVFHYEYNANTCKCKIYRTDQGGTLALGKWELQTSGDRLAMSLGLTHFTAQDMKNPNISLSQKTAVEVSTHYREPAAASLSTYRGWDILKPLTKDKQASPQNAWGHFIGSPNVVNVHANDSIYIRMVNLPSNGFESLSGGQTNILAVIPMYSGQNSMSFYMPPVPLFTYIGNSVITELAVRLTDAAGKLLDFNGVEHELQFKFECFREVP